MRSGRGGLLTLRTAFLIAVLLPAAATAQSVRGTVTDASQAPLAGAAVQLVHVETNRLRRTVTDALGGFAISSLPPGDYRIEAEHEGYRKHVRAGHAAAEPGSPDRDPAAPGPAHGYG